MTKTIRFSLLAVFIAMNVAVFMPSVEKENNHFGFGYQSAFALGSSEDGGCCGGGSSHGGSHTPTPTPTPTPKPAICNSLTADKTSVPYGGGVVKLTWSTSRGTSATLSPDGSSVAVNGSKSVNVTGDTTFVLNVSNSDGSGSCQVAVKMEPKKTVPVCNFLSASPTSLPYGGGDTVLTWETTDAGLVTIDHGVGTVSADGSKSVHVTSNTTYTLTASNVDGSNAKTCVANVTVGTPQTNGLTCSDVSFTASDTSVNPGDSVVLNWVSTGNVTGASIDHGIGSVSLTGNRTVTVNGDITYNITISNPDYSVSCPVSISTTNGGGGGDNSPYCALYASDRNIDPGQRVSLRWSTSHVNKVTLVDDNGNVLLESNDRSDMDSNLSVNPTEDTNYTLIAKRGSDEIKCDVKVKVADNIYVSSTRSQTPRVAGISLTQVPYTGFEAGPALTLIFYALLAAWALYVAYVFVIKHDTLGRVSLAGAHGNKTSFSDVSVENDTVANEVEAYVASAATATVPNNLPVAPVVDYTNTVAQTVDETEAEFANLENIAHSHKVLLSTDALRYLVNTFGNNENAEEALKAAIDKANATFPIENGWLVLNLSRLESLLA